jgi:hypothetical protein
VGHRRSARDRRGESCLLEGRIAGPRQGDFVDPTARRARDVDSTARLPPIRAGWSAHESAARDDRPVRRRFHERPSSTIARTFVPSILLIGKGAISSRRRMHFLEVECVSSRRRRSHAAASAGETGGVVDRLLRPRRTIERASRPRAAPRPPHYLSVHGPLSSRTTMHFGAPRWDLPYLVMPRPKASPHAPLVLGNGASRSPHLFERRARKFL